MQGTDVWMGVLMALLGGLFNGIFALPMRLMKKWKWENTWLIYSTVGMVIFPWIVAWMLTPNMGQVISQAPLLLIFGYGLAWGIGSVFFGLGIHYLGLGLGLALMMGIIAGLGSLIPMLVLDPAKATTASGAWIWVGNVVLILGITLCARAGGLREKMQKGDALQAASSQVRPGGALLIGLLVSVLAGLFSAMLQFSFTFSEGAQKLAIELGASPRTAGVVIFAMAVSAGYLANLVFCLSKLGSRGWSIFLLPGTGAYWLGAIVMGVLWFSSWIVYVIGASYMGPSGKIIGWPILMGFTIIASNIAGWFTGEWAGADRKTLGHLVVGVLVILGSIVVIAQGN
jgi:L-rhamnose-H+ transport protein